MGGGGGGYGHLKFVYAKYKLRFCTSCNLYRISIANKPNLYKTVVQVGLKKNVG